MYLNTIANTRSRTENLVDYSKLDSLIAGNLRFSKNNPYRPFLQIDWMGNFIKYEPHTLVVAFPGLPLPAEMIFDCHLGEIELISAENWFDLKRKAKKIESTMRHKGLRNLIFVSQQNKDQESSFVQWFAGQSSWFRSKYANGEIVVLSGTYLSYSGLIRINEFEDKDEPYQEVGFTD